MNAFGFQRLSALDELVLLAITSLDQSAYGVTIQQRLERETRSNVSLGAVYAVLDRLERDGLVGASWGESTPKRGGRRKRMFEVTAAGRAALRDMERIRKRLWRLEPGNRPA
jgi:PadR family transcriptional regulator, regulatory protein PadR